MVAVTLAHRQGYFTQQLGPDGAQREQPRPWDPAAVLPELPQRVACAFHVQCAQEGHFWLVVAVGQPFV